MSDDLRVPGFKSSDLIAELQAGFANASDAERKDIMKKINGIFELQISNGKETVIFTIDAKKTGTVYKGKAQPKADVTITLLDEVLVELANGKLNGQMAFLTGKLKIKGNILLAAKLDILLKLAKPKPKL